MTRSVAIHACTHSCVIRCFRGVERRPLQHWLDSIPLCSNGWLCARRRSSTLRAGRSVLHGTTRACSWPCRRLSGCVLPLSNLWVPTDLDNCPWHTCRCTAYCMYCTAPRLFAPLYLLHKVSLQIRSANATFPMSSSSVSVFNLDAVSQHLSAHLVSTASGVRSNSVA